jgi:hypothetical protein
MSLSTLIKGIQDIMRKDPGVDGDAQRLSQLAWLLFLKVFDAREEEYEIEEDDYRSPIPQDLRWRAWATDKEGIRRPCTSSPASCPPEELGHASEMRCMPTNSLPGGSSACSSRQSAMASWVLASSVSSDLDWVWHPRSSGTVAT